MTLEASVVVPTYNRRDGLRRVLTALAEQRVPDGTFEVIVVSDGSTDGTDDDLRAGRTPLPVVAITQRNQGPGPARNAGTERARSPLVIFVDDDVVASPDLVARHLDAHHRDGRDGRLVVIGPMLLPSDFDASPWIRWEQDKLQEQYDSMVAGEWAPTFRQFYTGNASLPRDLLLDAGGFDDRYRRAEDVELSYRLHQAGCRFAFDEDAIGWHYAERSFRSWIGNASDYGRNDVVFARDHDRPELLEFVRVEFPGRHPLVKAAVRAGVAVPLLGAALQTTTDAVARTAARTGLARTTDAALSIAYNLAYYRAVADELGGPSAFRRQIIDPPDHPPRDAATAPVAEP